MKRSIFLILVMAILWPTSASASVVNIGASDVKAISLKPISITGVRVIALANGSAEIVQSLGLGSTLVGRDIASTAPGLEKIPIVTAGHQMLAERIIGLKPTLVIVDPANGPQSAIDLIKKSKIKVVSISEAWQVGDIYRKVMQVAAAVGRTDLGNSLIAKMKAEVKAQQVAGKPKILFLYLRGTNAIYLIGGPGSGADSLIKTIGGVDVGAQTLKNPFNPLTAEALVKANPDIYLMMSKGLASVGGESGFLKLPGVAQTQAGKSAHIVTVDDSLLLSFGPRTFDLLNKLSAAIGAMK